MSNWSTGYVSDIEYVGNFFHHQTPSLLSFSCLLNGVEPPSTDQEFDYCELGCGQGVTAITLAACSPRGRFYAVDFNPAHIARAQALASETGLTNIELEEKSFQQMLDTTASGPRQFDFVTLHGVYTWVTPEVRREIVEILSRCVKPGGLVAVSYNSLPGWTGGLPIQRLLMEFAQHSPHRSDRQIEQSIQFAVELREAKASHLQGNPFLDWVVDLIGKGDRSYLAHEYLNRGWNPIYSADVIRELSEAKLDFVGAINPFDCFLDLTLTPPQRELLEQFDSPIMRETVKDFCMPTRFRADIFVRGARRLGGIDRDDRIRDMSLELCRARQSATFTIKVPLGEAGVPEDTYGPIFDALAEGPQTVGDLIDLDSVRGRPATSPVDVAGMLVGSGQALPRVAADDPGDGGAAKRYNDAITARAYAGRNVSRTALARPINAGRIALAAPVIGTGLNVNSVEQLVYHGLTAGVETSAEALSQHVWQPMARRGEAVHVDGKPVDGEAESLEVLRDHIKRILEEVVPLWRKLGAI